MAHDRMVAAESVKVSIFAQAALMIHGAVAALGEGVGGESATRLKEMVSTYNDLMSPDRITERESAMDKAKVILEAEEGKTYRAHRLDGAKVPNPSKGGRRGGLLHGRRKKPGG